MSKDQPTPDSKEGDIKYLFEHIVDAIFSMPKEESKKAISDYFIEIERDYKSLQERHEGLIEDLSNICNNLPLEMDIEPREIREILSKYKTGE